ncbi:MAG: SPASM domain-containing protein [Patescibacteria group bacterium]|nr:SPASM domain-containing protein [Patescibacteria group bacterium]
MIRNNLPKEKIVNKLLDRVFIDYPHKRTCGLGHHYLMINHKGKIISCPLLDDRVIGSIADENIVDTMIEKNIMPKTENVESINDCKDCPWRYVCCGGCPLLVYQKYGNFKSKTPMCNINKQLIPELIRLEAERIRKFNIVPNLIKI